MDPTTDPNASTPAATGGFDWQGLLATGLVAAVDQEFAGSQLPTAGAPAPRAATVAAPATAKSMMSVIVIVAVIGGVLFFLARKG